MSLFSRNQQQRFNRSVQQAGTATPWSGPVTMPGSETGCRAGLIRSIIATGGGN
jgi:hypothetical protein